MQELPWSLFGSRVSVVSRQTVCHSLEFLPTNLYSPIGPFIFFFPFFTNQKLNKKVRKVNLDTFFLLAETIIVLWALHPACPWMKGKEKTLKLHTEIWNLTESVSLHLFIQMTKQDMNLWMNFANIIILIIYLTWLTQQIFKCQHFKNIMFSINYFELTMLAEVYTTRHT